MGKGVRLGSGASGGVLAWCLICAAVWWTNPDFVDTAAGWLALALGAAAAGAGTALLPVSLRALGLAWGIAAPAAAVTLGVVLALRAPALPGRAGREAALPAPIFVLGLDGATWSVLDPLLDSGEAPHLAALIGRGARGRLMSLEPMMSPRLWASIDTGVHPERHGIVSFFSTQADLKSVRVWEWLAQRRGARVGLLEWYLTWPPPPSVAWAVPGLFAPDRQAQPQRLGFLKVLADLGRPGKPRPGLLELAGLGLDAVAGGMRLSTGLAAARLAGLRLAGASGDERYVEEHLLWARLKADVYARLIARTQPDYGALFLNEPDVFGHRYWKQHAEGGAGRLSEAVRDAYRVADHALGLALQAYGDRRPVVAVVSDHGFQSGTGGGAVRLKVQNLTEFARLRAQDLVWVEVGDDLYLRARSGADPGLPALAARRLRQMQAGGRPFLNVADGPDGGLRIRLAGPIDPRTPVQSGDLSYPAAVLLTGQRNTGKHDLAGVLVLSGPGVRTGVRLQGASVLDVAPTLLALAGEPVPEGLDGRVLAEALEPDWLAEQPLRTQPAWPARPAAGDASRAPEPEIEDQLRALGYVE
jgi:hypothetical protein